MNKEAMLDKVNAIIQWLDPTDPVSAGALDEVRALAKSLQADLLYECLAAPPETDERVAVQPPYVGAVVIYHDAVNIPCAVTHVYEPGNPYSRIQVSLLARNRDLPAAIGLEYACDMGCWSWPQVPAPVMLKKEEIR